MKKFNVLGLCIKDKHYMVDITKKIDKIKKMIDDELYFTINRARQYGKTTTLSLLAGVLSKEYVCAWISFEGVGESLFESEEKFCITFKKMIGKSLVFTSLGHKEIDIWNHIKVDRLIDLSECITDFCKDKKVVLLIDEVDKSSNNQIFLHFLGMLRDKYLLRNSGRDYTFHSVILVGVYDIKNIKSKIVKETDMANSEIKYNSPWNIAADFEVEMSFDPKEIASMLTQYEDEQHTGMDVTDMSQNIYDYTSGYPFLVSRLCQRIDEKLNKNWTKDGVWQAVKIMLDESNTLFDDLIKNLENNKELFDCIYEILILGDIKRFNIDNPVINLGYMFGIFKNEDGITFLANKIFELRIYEYLISKDQTNNKQKAIKGVFATDIIENGCFNMQLCMEKFAMHYYEMFNEEDITFLERHGRLLFLSYLRPLINGCGFYHIEPQTRNRRQMDIVVDYGKQQFVIELKIWQGNSYKQKAYQQLLDYMECLNADTGYLLTFDFTKNKVGCCIPQWVEFDGRKIFDVVV